jgi:hypothetical protein
MRYLNKQVKGQNYSLLDTVLAEQVALSTCSHVFEEAFVVTADCTLNQLISSLGSLEGCRFGSFNVLEVTIDVLPLVQIGSLLDEVHVLVQRLLNLVGASP